MDRGVFLSGGRMSGFPTTCWSQVAAARATTGPEARAALESLCAAYWFPLYAFVRRKGHGTEAALDLTQEYFARLLERGTIAAADATRGRFRTFLLADCTRFLADRRAHDGAAKRGGGVPPLSIDARDAEGRYVHEPADDRTPEHLFERDWAIAMLDAVLSRLRAEYEATGRGVVFDALKVALDDGGRATPHAELAARLGSTAGAVQVAIHRLRRRYRELVRDAIAATVAEPGDVDDEIRGLFLALGR
jgi:RNA polymerase sigma-70 factor (ECF subfamily)